MKKLTKILLLSFFATSLFGQAQEFGLASYYSDLFHGKPTASGELYDKDKLTAAHKTLPFGSVVKVTRLDNKKSVQVKINDRGPFISGRVVEVSREAARRLDLDKDGSARVSVEVVSQEPGLAAAKPADAPKSYEKEVEPVKPEAAKKEPLKETAAKKETATEKTAATKPAAPAAPKTATAPAKKETLTAKGASDKEKATAAAGTKKQAEPAAKPAKTEKPKAVLVKGASEFQSTDLYKIELKRPEKKGYGVQVAAMSNQDALFKKVAELQGDWFDNVLVSVEQTPKKETMYKVILGPFESEKEAQSYKASLKKKKKIDGFVIDLTALNKDKKD